MAAAVPGTAFMSGSIENLLASGRIVPVRPAAGVAALALASAWVIDAAMDTALDEGRTFVAELVRPDNHEIWIRLLVAALVFLLWVAELSRRRCHLLWAALVAAPDGVQITKLDGSIAYSNRSVQGIYGFTPEELRGKHVNDMNADPTFASREILPAIQQRGKWEGELEVKHKDGHVFPIWLTTSLVMDPRGRPMAAIGVIRDVSDRKRAERELREHARRLEEATGLKDLFADILRHDLAGPATTLQLSIDSLLRRELEPAASRRTLETARRNCARLIDMIESAATYAKVSSVPEIRLGTMDLAATLRGLAADLEPRMRERRTHIALDAPGPYPVRANPWIADAFENLLTNAAKYGPEGGTVAVRVDDEGPRWRVSVTDSGEGIPDEDKERVFTRFERLRKEAVKGTGLGLAIARRIVDLHGGRIWVEDAPGHGARFCVTLPKAGAPAAS